jgi:hypothetical protein
MQLSNFSDQTKEELLHVLNGNSTHTFVLDGKLFSIQVENFGTTEELINNQNIDIEREVEEYPELKASLQRYQDDPNMKIYTANELKEKRIANRK